MTTGPVSHIKFGLDIFSSVKRSCLFFAYNTKRTIEFILSWIFFSRKLGPGFCGGFVSFFYFSKSSCPPT